MTQGHNLHNIKGDLFNDPSNNLHGDLDQLSKDELKERLVVAEKVMKSLFQRNKELEDKANNEIKTTATTSNKTHSQEERQC